MSPSYLSSIRFAATLVIAPVTGIDALRFPKRCQQDSLGTWYSLDVPLACEPSSLTDPQVAFGSTGRVELDRL